MGCLHGLTSCMVNHRSIAPGFKPRMGYVRRVFVLSLRLITFGGRSAHLAYLVHKGGRKTATTFLWPYTMIDSINWCRIPDEVKQLLSYIGTEEEIPRVPKVECNR